MAPNGTVTVKLVTLAAVTTAWVAPKKTMFCAAVVLKFVPVMIIVLPMAPDSGEKEVMVGAGKNVNPSRLPVPPGVVTLTIPEVPVSTTAVMFVALTTLKEVAAVPPKLTAVAPVKMVPVMVIVVPKIADAGVKEVMVGGGINVNPSRVPVPPGVVTLTVPEVPFGTMAMMLVALTILNEVAAVPPKLTAEAPVKLVPVMVTVAPVTAVSGVK